VIVPNFDAGGLAGSACRGDSDGFIGLREARQRWGGEEEKESGRHLSGVLDYTVFVAVLFWWICVDFV
jgi:hypothetical protein